MTLWLVDTDPEQYTIEHPSIALGSRLCAAQKDPLHVHSIAAPGKRVCSEFLELTCTLDGGIVA